MEIANKMELDALQRKAVMEAIENGIFILSGGPGTGKTTLASIVANQTNSFFVSLNAVSCGVADVKKVIADAKSNI